MRFNSNFATDCTALVRKCRTPETPIGMYAEVTSALHDKASDGVETPSSTDSKPSFKTAALAAVAAATLRAGRSVKDAEIANHYNSKLKYGVAGSSGTLWSNYYRYTMNNHELLSVFFADRRNPYNRQRRLFVIISKLSLSLLLAAAFSTAHPDRYDRPGVATPANVQFNDSFVISLILSPYGYILDNIASCAICTRANCCVPLFTSLSYCTLFWIAFVSIFFLIGGILIAVYSLRTNAFVSVFFVSMLLDSASYFYFGIWNWLLLSWEGFLFIPVFPAGGSGYPPRYMPIFAFWPLQKFLQMYWLCESTYAEDRETFQRVHPQRIAVDQDEQERSHSVSTAGEDRRSLDSV
jgi:hypothetical protein